MPSTAQVKRTAWQNRWTQPEIEDLLASLKAQPRRLFEVIIARLDEDDRLTRKTVWYGDSWNWTIQFTLPAGQSHRDTGVCYLVPNLETPLVCIPLDAAVIDALPWTRLPKYVRDGIRSAKCAVSQHWAIWSPITQGEATHLLDLIERKVGFLCDPETAETNN